MLINPPLSSMRGKETREREREKETGMKLAGLTGVEMRNNIAGDAVHRMRQI